MGLEVFGPKKHTKYTSSKRVQSFRGFFPDPGIGDDLSVHEPGALSSAKIATELFARKKIAMSSIQGGPLAVVSRVVTPRITYMIG